MTIGIFYDSLLSNGGAEKVVVELANDLGAEIITAGFNRKALTIHPVNPVHDIGNYFARFSKSFGYIFEAPLRFFMKKHKYSYDVHIYIGYTSIYGVRKKNNNIWYCLTPNRILYDLRQEKISQQNIAGKLFIQLYVLFFFLWDKKCVSSFSTIVSQTKNIQSRVKKYYGIDSRVIYPPVPNTRFKNVEIGDYFLGVSRLFPEKRMTLIAKAFAEMPDEKVILIGSGPERQVIEKISKNCPNITLLQDISEKDLRKLYAGCRATIYMSVNEDFGLVPLEGMAAGKPCIAANEGGCKETVRNNITGFLIDPNIIELKDAVNRMSKMWVLKHRDECNKQADMFNKKLSLNAWESLLKETSLYA